MCVKLIMAKFHPNCHRLLTSGLCLLLLMLASSLHAQENPDPWEPMNRKLYAFNDTLDTWVITPVARGYQTVVPGVARSGIRNFFRNLGEIRNATNNALQLKFPEAASDSGRFVINSTIGVAGFFDVATGMGLERSEEDFGQTLGVWGIGTGPYLVVPFIGNSTLRGTVGLVPDILLNPVFWLQDEGAGYALYALERIDTRVTYFSADELIRGDEYVFVRDALLQRRNYLVNDGEVDDDSWDEWDDW